MAKPLVVFPCHDFSRFIGLWLPTCYNVDAVHLDWWSKQWSELRTICTAMLIDWNHASLDINIEVLLSRQSLYLTSLTVASVPYWTVHTFTFWELVKWWGRQYVGPHFPQKALHSNWSWHNSLASPTPASLLLLKRF